MNSSNITRSDKPSALAVSLEPRFMFDAAGVATGAEVAEQSASEAEATAAAAADGDTANQESTAQKEVYFIDSAVSDADNLAASLGDDADIVMLQSDVNGLDQIAAYLSNQSDVDAIHILSHGSDGTVYLGDNTLNSNNLSQYSTALGKIGQSLSQDGDILLYGCNIGASATGTQFISDLAAATGADVAASDDVTGINGDWILESTTGTIDIDLSIVPAALESYEHDMATFDFTGASDNGSSVTQTVSTVTLTATSSNGSAIGVIDGGGFGGSSGNVLIADDGGSTASSLTLNFDKAVDITSLRAIDGNGATTTDWTFTPDTGSAVVTSVDGSSGATVSLNFSGVTSVTITATTDIDFGVDTIIFDVASTDPTITSATYDASSGNLTVTGTNFTATSGAANDIDASKLTITGEGGETYTLTDTSDVEISSSTEFTLSLSATDKAAIDQILNKDGTSSTGGTTYDVDGAAGFVTDSASVSDTDANSITVSNVATPTISSATYDYSTNTLTVTGSGFVKSTGATNDIDISKLTFTGEGGATYTLTSASDVEITDGTTFSVTLSGADITGVESLLNKDGTASDDATTYNLAAAEDWAAGADAAVNVADLTGNGITVANYAAPSITSATYNWATGQLTLTGTNFVTASGASNDIDASLLTLTGEGGATYTLTDTSDVDVTSATSAAVTLSATDLVSVNGLLNKDGTTSDDATTYNLAAADNWMAGAPAANNIADGTSAVTVSNYAAPTVTSASYDYSTNTLTVTGTNFVAQSGASNDIDLSKLTFTGEGGAAYTLTSASDVEVTDGTTFSVTLSGADITGVESLLNKDGTASDDATTYNLAAADNWMAGAASSNDISDTAGNGITVSNYAAPSITSATYDWATGQLTLTGTNFVTASGASNDIDASLLTLTGESGATYTLTDTSDVEITSATSATLTLSSSDQLNVEGLLNKDGTTSGGGTTYNVSAADNWMAGAPAGNDLTDATTAVTVSNVVSPTVTSATYDSDSGVLTVTGTNLTKADGSSNDINISTITLTGEGGSYTLTSASDVEITDETTFSVTLSGSDKTNVDALLDQIGTSSSGGTTYNIAVADNWMTAADTATDISDTTGNGITVTINPKITSATYDASTGTLVVTGTNIQANSGGSDIDASKFTITGEGGATYTLTDTADVERDSVSQFTLTLSATDKAALNQILNKDGSSSTDGTTFNIAAGDDWDTNVTSGDTSDTTGNSVTVSNVAVPTISSATYDVSTNQLVVTGTGFLQASGTANDIDVSKLTITGEGGNSYTLTSATDVEITSGTSFSITLSAADAAAVEALTQANGKSAADGTTYNLAAADNWAAGADAAVDVADLSGNSITVSNFSAPSITSATYDWNTGKLVLTGSDFIAQSGSANDIDASLLTLTGEGGATYTLTDTSDVEITSATGATLTLSATDQLYIEGLLNKDGTSSDDASTYNLSAADDWMNGSASSLNIQDGTTGITVSNYAAPTISSATYDASTNTLTVTGTNFVAKAGSANDIDLSLLTLTGPDSASYTLTTTTDVDVTSATQFSVTLNATDTAAVEAILTTNDNTGSVYGLTAADNWLVQAPGSADLSESSGLTVSGVAAQSDDSTSLNVSQNGGQGTSDDNAPVTETDSSQELEGNQTSGDALLDPLLSPDAGASDTTTTVSVLLENQSASAEAINDPSAGIDALTVVRNAITGNDNALNHFYGAGRTADTAPETSGGLNGLTGQEFNNLTGSGLGLSELVNSMLGNGAFGEDGSVENEQLSPDDFSKRETGFSAQLAKFNGIRETVIMDTLKGRS